MLCLMGDCQCSHISLAQGDLAYIRHNYTETSIAYVSLPPFSLGLGLGSSGIVGLKLLI